MSTEALLVSRNLYPTTYRFYTIFLCVLFLCSVGYGQVTVFERTVAEKEFNSSYGTPRCLVSGPHIFLLFSNKKDFKTMKFDRQFKLVDELDATKPSVFAEPMGMNSNGDNLIVYFSFLAKSYYLATTFNFATRTLDTTHITLPSKSGKVIATFTYENKFHIVNTVQGTSQLNIFVLETPGKYELKTVDFSANDACFRMKTLHGTLKLNDLTNMTYGEFAETVDIASKNKFYIDDDELIITTDNAMQHTALLTVNLKSFASSFKCYPKIPADVTFEDAGTSNSWYDESGKLFQMKTFKHALYMTAIDVKSDQQLFHYVINSKKLQPFVRFDVYEQNQGAFYNSFEKKDYDVVKFVNKISILGGWIQTVKSDEGLVMRVGAGRLLSNVSPGPPGMPGAATVTVRGYKSFNFQSVLDSTSLRPTNLMVDKKNPFDTMLEYSRRDELKLSYLKGYFFIGDHCYLTCYSKADHKFLLVEF